MVHGIADGKNKDKYVDKTDEKWLCKDLNEYKATVQNYIDEIRPDEDAEETGKNKIKKQKKMTIDRIIAIIFLGVFGSVVLVAGLYFFIKNPGIVSGFLALIGVVFVLCFFLYEKYR